MVSPPKPWERGYVKNSSGTMSTPLQSTTSLDNSNTTLNNDTPNNDSTNINASKTDAPSLPPRPSSTSLSRTGYDGYDNSGYGNTYGNTYGSTYGNTYGSSYGYGGLGSSYGTGYGGLSSYSPYSRYGGYGSTGYSPYSSYGSYGSYGLGGYGGYNRMGLGYPGGMMGGNNEFSLTRQMEESTQSAFQTISSIVQAFGGFAQMLDSTFCATHSSFMAMVGVADQLSHLKGYLGEVFSLFNLVKYIKRWLGMEKPNINADEFDSFTKKNPNVTSGSVDDLLAKPKSRKPVYLFILFLFGFPYLMSKLINIIKRRQQQQLASQGQFLPMPGGLDQAMVQGHGMASTSAASLNSFPRNAEGKPIIEFARCLYDFQSQNPIELTIKKGDIIAIISKLDPNGQPSQWWKGRLQQGNTGIFPSNYVELIPTKKTNDENKNEESEKSSNATESIIEQNSEITSSS